VRDDDHVTGWLCFGVFELHLRAGELRKHGLLVRLQEPPFQLLAMLLEHPGDVVTGEELQKKLRPADTFLDFDHRLNKAIGKIREALSDTALESALGKNRCSAWLPFPCRRPVRRMGLHH
jgi:DNA-binding winged helix-turn-helix (wHTH) protein